MNVWVDVLHLVPSQALSSQAGSAVKISGNAVCHQQQECEKAQLALLSLGE